MTAGESGSVESCGGTEAAEKSCAICDKACRYQHYGTDACEACAGKTKLLMADKNCSLFSILQTSVDVHLRRYLNMP